ncbi:MAG: YiiX/YebB-like N1pC/P60 family cysteine hydrolase [Gammaproteobacteria bacterium]
MLSTIPRALGRLLASYLSKSLPGYQRLDTVSIEKIAEVLQTGDIILVEGNTRISIAIKYLTQSSWSHAALYVGETGSPTSAMTILEADLQDGVRLINLDHYANFNLRICRPVSLTDDETGALIEFAKSRLGHHYDLKNVFDLVRYLIQKPAIPNRYRRAMLGLGSGEPTRAICSTLIAEAFQSVDYPILPLPRKVRAHEGVASSVQDAQGKNDVGDAGEVPEFYKRHFTHFTPRDFDLSPYFKIIKPTIEAGFDFHNLQWRDVEDITGPKDQ